jgi:hypothetical protein
MPKIKKIKRKTIHVEPIDLEEKIGSIDSADSVENKVKTPQSWVKQISIVLDVDIEPRLLTTGLKQIILNKLRTRYNNTCYQQYRIISVDDVNECKNGAITSSGKTGTVRFTTSVLATVFEIIKDEEVLIYITHKAQIPLCCLKEFNTIFMIDCDDSTTQFEVGEEVTVKAIDYRTHYGDNIINVVCRLV